MSMPSAPIGAITFDFWRTLFYANSNLDLRRRARVETVMRITGLPAEPIKEAMKFATREFLRIHIAERRTLVPMDAVPMLEQCLGVSFEPRAAEALATELADALLKHPPDPLQGALEAVQVAASHVPVGLISDTGMSPGSTIQSLLEREGFLDHFSSLSFSDEVGEAKPGQRMFAHAAERLKVEGAALLHIGDLEPTDVAGARAFGARAALFTGDNERYREGTRADYVFDSWGDFVEKLPGILG